MTDLWTLPNGSIIRTVIERIQQEITLPIRQDVSPTVRLISGALPRGLRLDNNTIKGTPFEVVETTSSVFVLRASLDDGSFQDRTFEIITVGADDPSWLTPEGLLQVNQKAFFILDNELVDFALQAIDPDVPAGDELEFYISSGDGELPPGLHLTKDGRIVGVVEPLLALDKRADNGNYDSNVYDGYPLDFNITSDNGYSSYYYDSQFYDYSIATRIPKKLNRFYEFTVSVTDGDAVVKRKFRIFVVGDDFLRSDNTILKVGSGIFTADNTHVRTPIWLTPANLGYKRADNYLTLKLDALDTDTLQGYLLYTLVNTNPDGSISKLPPGMSLDIASGEVYGRVPYQPAVTREYQFTVRATRFTGETNIVAVTGQVFEDTQKGQQTFKIFKLDRTLADGIDDLNSLLGRRIVLEGYSYLVTAVDGTLNDYDQITVSPELRSNKPFIIIEPSIVGSSYAFSNQLDSTTRDFYLNRAIRITNNEKYTIKSITPYLEWTVTDQGNSSIGINNSQYPSQGRVSSISIVNQGLNYSTALVSIIGDGAGATAEPVIDQFGRIVAINVTNGGSGYTTPPQVQITGTFNGTAFAASATATLALESRDEQISRLFNTDLGPVYINETASNRLVIRLPNTTLNRNADRIRDIFSKNNSSSVRVISTKDPFERVTFDINLQRSLVGDFSIGAGKGSVFEERIVVSEDDDEVTNPFTDKTFTVKILGEVESTIQWLTPAHLGSIRANFLSTLFVEAQTSVPNAKMVYTIVDGKLPNGLILTYDGQIVGRPRQFSSVDKKGLTVFDSNSTTFDGGRTSATSFDRQYRFTVRAQDRFGYSAVEREFYLVVEDPNDIIYSNLYMKPFLPASQRQNYINFISDPTIFPPEYIYRPNDPEFGLQKEIKMLAYAGIETKEIKEYVSAVAKNHKRKRYTLGNIKKAVAKEPGTNNVIYEVVYLEVNDPAEPLAGNTHTSFNLKTENKITADSLQYALADDVTKTGAGVPEILVQGRYGTVSVPLSNSKEFEFLARDNTILENTVNNLTVEFGSRADNDIEVDVNLSDSEPYRLRPKTNTIKADSNAVQVSQSKDNVRYISNISNMRSRLSEVGSTDNNFMPLWMRSTQAVGQQELGFITAVPLCYCKPNTADEIILNIKNTDFNFTDIDFEVDRYIIDTTQGNSEQQYIMFANYQFNA